MRFLLDTHVWLWSLLTPAQLSVQTQAALTNTQHELYLSPISIWESLLLIERGRIKVAISPTQWVTSALKHSSLVEAPLTHRIAIRSRAITLPHRDPADRFIAATALEMGLTLMTADRILLNHQQVSTRPAAV